MNAASCSTIRNSALWAAYGDALGFITELADAAAVKRRIGHAEVTGTVAWKRGVGGRFGTVVDLPAGCYSDDTQLRLATSRTILGDHTFDVEAFAKIELTVWPSYALGGGKGTKAAAAALSTLDVNWFSNFFDGAEVRYLEAGGNGAAMRIQPHVWAATDLSKPDSFLRDVVRNAVCTHGHPRGILGAVFHALCLAHALRDGTAPGPRDWSEAIALLYKVAAFIEVDNELSAFWRPVWEERAGTTLGSAFERVAEECSADVVSVTSHLQHGGLDRYRDIVERLGCVIPEYRGSGTKTALAAAALAWLAKDEGPERALLVGSNLLLTDTDTIATMAGAIMGATFEDTPSGEVMDRSYIESEATRLWRLSYRENTTSFAYPDLMRWMPPKSQLDAVGTHGDRLVLAGLGYAEPFGQEFRSRGNAEYFWQWLRLDFGQAVVGKCRSQPAEMAACNLPVPAREPRTRPIRNRRGADEMAARQEKLFGNGGTMEGPEVHSTDNTKSLDELSSEAIRSGFDPSLIGRHLLELAGRPDGIEKGIAYASIIAKAKIARVQAQQRHEAPHAPRSSQKGPSGGN